MVKSKIFTNFTLSKSLKVINMISLHTSAASANYDVSLPEVTPCQESSSFALDDLFEEIRLKMIKSFERTFSNFKTELDLNDDGFAIISVTLPYIEQPEEGGTKICFSSSVRLDEVYLGEEKVSCKTIWEWEKKLSQELDDIIDY